MDFRDWPAVVGGSVLLGLFAVGDMHIVHVLILFGLVSFIGYLAFGGAQNR